MIPVLENRWILKDNTLKYYGLRKKPYTFKNTVNISASTAKIIQSFDGIRHLSECKINGQIKQLIKKKIIVDVHSKRTVPDTIDNAFFCKNCCSNDYVMPGIEFDDNGLCPVCTNMPSFKNIKDVLPIVNTIEHNEKAKYDVALFYTGGKDSTFLLYYFADVLKLKVLALTWDIPFMSDNAIKSMNNAKEIFTDTDFISKALNDEEQAAIYKKSYELMKNVCICPFAAYPLFLKELRDSGVKYVVSGNEPAQPINLIFNNLSPKTFYNPLFQMLFRALYNMVRIFKGLKPLKKGRMEMLLLLETLAFGQPRYISAKTVRNPMIRNIHETLKEADVLITSFRKEVEQASLDGNIPALIHIDFNDIIKSCMNNVLSDGYVWKDIKALLTDKAGWIDSGNTDSGLHTSCKIERCKDFSQYQSFKAMESDIIPFSALELSVAVNLGSLTREDAIKEIRYNSGFTDVAPCETEIMIKSFK